MLPDHSRWLACPSCYDGTLEVADDAIGAECLSCGAKYPVVRGLLRFVNSEEYTGSFGLQWKSHTRTQLDSYTGVSVSRDRLFQVTGWKPDLQGEVILEAGSGAGRFTEVLARTGAEVLSFDLSQAVEANYDNNGSNPNVLIFQADIFKIPVQPQSMDKVICLGVLQHTPDPAAAFASLASHVRPGGELVIDVYALRLRGILHWKRVLRPLTTRMDTDSLYRVVAKYTPPLIPVSAALRRVAGKAGARLLPISQYDYLGLSPEVNREWAILDTFDMYSPAHDHPQTIRTVTQWYRDAGFVDIVVQFGLNGVVGRGRRPADTG